MRFSKFLCGNPGSYDSVERFDCFGIAKFDEKLHERPTIQIRILGEILVFRQDDVQNAWAPFRERVQRSSVVLLRIIADASHPVNRLDDQRIKLLVLAVQERKWMLRLPNLQRVRSGEKRSIKAF